jgi:hypothetical protein
LLSELLPNGIGTGTGLRPEDYYLARGWDENGLVPKPKPSYLF